MKKIISKITNKLEGKLQKHETKLKVGDKAPDLKGIDQNGKMYDANSIKGKK